MAVLLTAEWRQPSVRLSVYPVRSRNAKRKTLETSHSVEIFSLARLTGVSILGQKGQSQGHTGQLKFRIDADSAEPFSYRSVSCSVYRHLANKYEDKFVSAIR